MPAPRGRVIVFAAREHTPQVPTRSSGSTLKQVDFALGVYAPKLFHRYFAQRPHARAPHDRHVHGSLCEWAFHEAIQFGNVIFVDILFMTLWSPWLGGGEVALPSLEYRASCPGLTGKVISPDTARYQPASPLKADT